MQAVDLFQPGPEPAPAARAPSAPPHKATEQFDTFMGRALARSNETDDSAADEPPPSDEELNRPKQANATDAPPENLPIVPPPPPTETPPAPLSSVEVASVPSVPGVQSPALPVANSPGTASLISDAQSAPADPKLAEELSTLSGEKTVDPAAKSISAATPASPAEATGISGAKYRLAMQKAENTNNFTGSTEQNLPVDAAVGPGEESPAQAIHPATTPHEHRTSPAIESATVSGPASATEVTSTAAAAGVDWPSPARSLERTHELMALHGVRLRESGEDSLRVVIKPDAGLQLSLNLQMRDGNVEMRALLHRGNFEFLNLHWNELQQQLESRGIRLAPLAQGDPLADGGAELFQESNQQQPRENTQANGAFAEFALNSTLVPTPAKRGAAAARGWESWA